MTAVNLTREQAEVLRRCAVADTVYRGKWTKAVERLYDPLVTEGLLARTEHPAPGRPGAVLVHYDTTAAGLWALAVWDRQHARDSAEQRERERQALIARRMELAKDRNEYRADVEAWNRLHPDQEPLDPNIPEVDAAISDLDRKLGIQ